MPDLSLSVLCAALMLMLVLVAIINIAHIAFAAFL